MKLFFFQCGSIKTRRSLLVKDGGDASFVVPVPFFLIKHEKGSLLYDCGQPLSAVGDDKRPPFERDFISLMAEEDYAPRQLWKAGLAPADITHLVISHMHSDHVGALGSFPNAVHFVQKAELEHGDNRENLARLALKTRVLNGEPVFDVFGDGAVKILFTPGHSPGHQSLLLELPESGRRLLAGDSVYVEEILSGALPGAAQDSQAERRSLLLIQKLKAEGVAITTGHDPGAWRKLPLAPAWQA